MRIVFQIQGKTVKLALGVLKFSYAPEVGKEGKPVPFFLLQVLPLTANRIVPP